MLTLLTSVQPTLIKLLLPLCILLIFLYINRKDSEKRKTDEKYKESLNAILFLLNLEEKHCRNNEELHGKSMRNTLRKFVLIEDGVNWNSKFSKAKVLDELNKIENKDNKDFSIFKRIIEKLLMRTEK